MIRAEVQPADRDRAVALVSAAQRNDGGAWRETVDGAFLAYGGVERLLLALAQDVIRGTDGVV